jgi:hypothetical protein
MGKMMQAPSRSDSPRISARRSKAHVDAAFHPVPPLDHWETQMGGAGSRDSTVLRRLERGHPDCPCELEGWAIKTLSTGNKTDSSTVGQDMSEPAQQESSKLTWTLPTQPQGIVDIVLHTDEPDRKGAVRTLTNLLAYHLEKLRRTHATTLDGLENMGYIQDINKVWRALCRIRQDDKTNMSRNNGIRLWTGRMDERKDPGVSKMGRMGNVAGVIIVAKKDNSVQGSVNYELWGWALMNQLTYS